MSDKPENNGKRKNYEVGYGKPPKHSQFAKGQSGNPRGRPRKPKPRPTKLGDAVFDRFLEQEAYRPVTLRENGKPIELPAMQALLRSMFAEGIKGKRLAQQFLVDLITNSEDEYLNLRVKRYADLEALKRDGERRLAEHAEQGLPPPDLLPHPDDIILNTATFEAHVAGPELPDDVPFYEHMMQLRDHLLLRAVHADETGVGPTVDHNGGSFSTYQVFAQILDRLLPRRLRWRDNAEVHLYMKYLYLTESEREQRIAEEARRLEAERPPSFRLPSEVEWEVQRIGEKVFGRRG